ncbi:MULTISPECIES: PhzF family phenazine biosynthesis protein [unclassified Streptomyces]|uniref:PhzF family phenazine biosynthesis protein n=1 Tax=unclassified Streptomyces TaxID=2593676 RepID=UPI000F6FEC8D|nr:MULTISPECIES: PhzF family phenazine biosynthesis protein [unclassified Streptomyces]AZM59426.1 PhzF family phenazine biosynthesis protein [Streptomyces sp. WAC 01438]RSM94067.1 PhzF family phenazine biosynthesis protein [Streptomyces sp. WAC 01420]
MPVRTAPLPYDIVDVFTERPYAGNPLAVVHGGGTLSDEAMQSIAREFNLSETVFVLPRTVGHSDYRVRIFTPARELPFAGHPSIGTAWLLARRGEIGLGEVRQECGAGVIEVFVGEDGAGIAGGTPETGKDLDAAALAAAVGLEENDIDTDCAAGIAAAGVPFACLSVRGGSVSRARPDAGRIMTHTAGAVGLVVFGFAPRTGHAHVRMFAPGAGVAEDPGGGASALALGVHLVHRGMLPANGISRFTIAQGAELGRPSALEVEVGAEGGRAVETLVRGSVVDVARGELVRFP